MTVNFMTQSSLVQPKASLSAKTLQNPSLSQLSRLSPPSRVGFLQSKRSGIVQKAPLASAVSDSSSSVLETEKSSKNPIIVIDNYDSFTHNLCQFGLHYLGEMGCHFEVYRNDEVTVEELKSPFSAGRYHCFVIEKNSFPWEALEVTAWTENGLIMVVRIKVYKHLKGVQFRPESIITPEGKTIVRNFFKLREKRGS